MRMQRLELKNITQLSEDSYFVISGNENCTKQHFRDCYDLETTSVVLGLIPKKFSSDIDYLRAYSITVKPPNSHTPNSHTYSMSHNLFGLMKM